MRLLLVGLSLIAASYFGLTYVKENLSQLCPLVLEPTSIKVKANVSDFIISQNKNLSELTQLFEEVNQKPAGGNVMGLTKTEIDYKLDASVDAIGFLNLSCGTPKVTVNISYKKPEIYIASEIAPESCMYYSVLEHEGLHAAAYNKHVTGLEKELQILLNSRYPANFLFQNQSFEAMMVRMRMLVDQELPELIQESIAKSKDAQAAIDTKEEYEKVKANCLGPRG